MTLSVETIIVVALMMAVFAAVSTIGSSLYLGAGYERLRNGFESIKKQTAFFSDAIHKLDTRVDAVEKQSGYFFQAITNLEQQAAMPAFEGRHEEDVCETGLIMSRASDALHSGTGNLLTGAGFSVAPSVREPQRVPSEATPGEGMHFH